MNVCPLVLTVSAGLLVALEARDKLRPKVVLGANARQCRERRTPGNLALGAKRHRRRRSRWIVEASGGHAEFPALKLEEQRRSAILAEPALRQVRAAKHRRFAARPAQVALIESRERHERLTGSLLAHPAVADAGALGRSL